ncbi:SPOR domain-containing protein [Brevundimonas sp.]|uniref:SPOR domain-containing protein n=1 Tax=Brevundimonas sp. TaxID=1871086 RepID=UPI0028A0A4A7|nr:SPOR domain-containing protein [Brevundimonas sp.]
MNASVILRLGSVGALAALLSGCGMAEADPHRFEGVADRIAAIPLSAKPAPAREPAGPRNAEEAGLRPLKVELLTPHQLWDARDGLTAKAAAVLPAMPAVFHDPEAPPEVQAAQRAEAQPLQPVAVAASAAPAVLIQLGAYASQASAQAAWERLGQGSHGLNPVFEPVEVNGRRLVRLKVRAGSAQAKALCERAAASDPWCVRAAEAASSTGAA